MPVVQEVTDPLTRCDGNPFLLDPLFKNAQRNIFVRLAKVMLEKMLGLRHLATKYDGLPPSDSPQTFVQQTFKTLDIRYQVVAGDLQQLPQQGATLVVANHPFGGVEGMLMVELLLQRRQDVRIIANGFLKRIPELAEVFIGVNPYGQQNARRENFSAMREGLRWLKQGGVLVMFPAGDVSSIKLRHLTIEEGNWDKSVARLALAAKAPVLPLHFSGRNSVAFYLASLIHPLLKTVMLPRQLINKKGRPIQVHIGKAIECKRLEKLASDTERAAYLRLRTQLLAQQAPADAEIAPTRHTAARPEVEPVIEPIAVAHLKQEIERLSAQQCLLESGGMQVYYASASQIPWLLQEIGRLREISFRAVGEGSGKKVDIDLYDSFYLHLFIWDKQANEIIGGYRLGLVDKILNSYGRNGLYSYSLFKLRRTFLKDIHSAVELGRSFVRPEHQRSFAPLMLLWKGIGKFIASHPQYSILFGPVSISDDYSSVSQKLLIDFLRMNEFDSGLSKKVRARTPYDKSRKRRREISGLRSLEDLSALLADIESDNKGVPVLIRQYLKFGGRMLGFNVDRDFSNVVDGLIHVDLRHTDPRILNKYMGREAAEAFIAWHNPTQRQTG